MKKINDLVKVYNYGFVADRDAIWMPLYDANGLCKIDKIQGTTTVEMLFDEYGLKDIRLYNAIIRVENKFVFVPAFAKHVAIYDIENKKNIYIKLEEPVGQFNEKYLAHAKFYYYIVRTPYVYIFGLSYPAILKINVITLEIEYLTDWVMEIDSHIPYGDTYTYFTGMCYINDAEAYLSVGGAPYFVKLNFLTDETSCIAVQQPLDGISGLAFSDGELWFYGRKEKYHTVYCWNFENNKIQKINELSNIESELWSPFWLPVVYKERIFLPPADQKKFYVINKCTKRVEADEALNELLLDSDIFPCGVFFAKRVGDKLLFQKKSDFTVYELDLESEEVIYKFQPVIRDKVFELKYLIAECMLEGEISLSMFLSIVDKIK